MNQEKLLEKKLGHATPLILMIDQCQAVTTRLSSHALDSHPPIAVRIKAPEKSETTTTSPMGRFTIEHVPRHDRRAWREAETMPAILHYQSGTSHMRTSLRCVRFFSCVD